MKKLVFNLLVGMLTIFIYSCSPYYRIIHENDSYKGISKTYLSFSEYALPKPINDGVYHWRKHVIFRFENIKNSEPSNIIKFKLEVSLNQNNHLEKDVYFKTQNGTKKIKLNLEENIIGGKVLPMRKDTSIFMNCDGFGMYYKMIKAEAILSDSLLRDIIYSDNVNIRFYISENPYDIKLGRYKIKEIKKLIATIKSEK